LHGGEGENGCVQGTLEMLGIPYNGSSVLASALCMDKYKTSTFLRSQGFDVPANHLIDKKAWQLDQKKEIATLNKTVASVNGTFIVKPHDDGCSVLVHKVRNEQELINAVDAIFADGKSHALVEEYVQGMELTVGVIGNSHPQALPPSQAVSAGEILSIEEKFLPGAGENQTPAPLAKEILTFVRKTIEEVYAALNCKGYSRIDCFYQNAKLSPTGFDRLVILEVNTLPGLTPATCIFHQAAEIGLKPMDFMDLIVELGFEEHSRPSVVAHDATHNNVTSGPALEKF
jgi:UDP-N-acetylmuramate--alanine ligase